MILWDVTRFLSPVTINHKMINEIIITYREPGISDDRDIVWYMVHFSNGVGRDIDIDEQYFTMSMSVDVQ